MSKTKGKEDMKGQYVRNADRYQDIGCYEKIDSVAFSEAEIYEINALTYFKAERNSL